MNPERKARTFEEWIKAINDPEHPMDVGDILMLKSFWNAALDWAAENMSVKILYPIGYEDANTVIKSSTFVGELLKAGPDFIIGLDKQSILNGKIK